MGLQALLEKLSPAARTQALLHPAFASTHGDSYERLEFLGDAVLGSVLSAELYSRYPEANEGELSRTKAVVVARAACAQVAREADLGTAMVEHAPADADATLLHDLSRHERVLAALTESVIGAAFLELGYAGVSPHVAEAFSSVIDEVTVGASDYKSQLQEYAQRRGDSVGYALVEAAGPDHDRTFTMEAQLVGVGATARGVGRTKKAAEQVAAARLLELMGGEADPRGAARSGEGNA